MSIEAEPTTALTPMGRRRRGPKPSSAARRINGDGAGNGNGYSIIATVPREHWRYAAERSYVAITTELLAESRNKIDEMLAEFRRRDERRVAMGMEPDAEPKAARIVSSAFWMLRKCGWDGLDDAVWDWWLDYLEIPQRLELWKITSDGWMIEAGAPTPVERCDGSPQARATAESAWYCRYASGVPKALRRLDGIDERHIRAKW